MLSDGDAKRMRTRREREDGDVIDVYWVCLKPHCACFFLNPTQRDKHMETYQGFPEVPW